MLELPHGVSRLSYGLRPVGLEIGIQMTSYEPKRVGNIEGGRVIIQEGNSWEEPSNG